MNAMNAQVGCRLGSLEARSKELWNGICGVVEHIILLGGAPLLGVALPRGVYLVSNNV